MLEQKYSCKYLWNKGKNLRSMREKNSKNSSNGKKKSTSNSTRKKKVSPKIDEILEVSNDKGKVVRTKVDSIKDIYDPSVEKESASDVVVEVVGPSSEKGKENALEKGVSSKEFSSSKEVALYEPDKASDPLTVYIREINRYDLLSIEQEQALTKALEETGDIEIARKLVLANLRLVVANAKNGTQTKDLYSMMGFTKAYNTAKKTCG